MTLLFWAHQIAAHTVAIFYISVWVQASTVCAAYIFASITEYAIALPLRSLCAFVWSDTPFASRIPLARASFASFHWRHVFNASFFTISMCKSMSNLLWSHTAAGPSSRNFLRSCGFFSSIESVAKSWLVWSATALGFLLVLVLSHILCGIAALKNTNVK